LQDLVAIAKIAKPRGLKGELVADLLTDFPERFEGLIEVTGVGQDGERRKLKIENTWFQNGRVVLKFEDVDSIELDSDEYYDWQLVGCNAVTVEGEKLGSVREVMRTGGTENLVVAGETREFLIPFAEAICVEVDVEKKRIVIDPPEGLLEF